MACSKVQALLPAYVDGELRRADRDFVRTHISECSHCAEELRCHQILKNFLAADVSVEPSPQFEERLVRNVLGAPVAVSQPARRWRLTIACATAAMAVVCTVIVSSRMNSTEPTIYVAKPEPTFDLGRDQAFSGSAGIAGTPVVMPAGYGSP